MSNYIALRVTDDAALSAITATRGIRAMLPNGQVYVQQAAPYGTNWIAENPAGGIESYGGSDTWGEVMVESYVNV